jgi:ABC-2 type transport system permease protein
MLRAELAKQLRRPRTVAVYAAALGFAILLAVALGIEGPGRVEHVGDVPLLMVPSSSGLVLAVIALSSTMKFFLPLAVCLFAGETVAGEASWGTLRYLLAGPRSRARVLAVKLAVAALLALVAVVLVPLGGTLVGTIAFGWHVLTVGNGAAGSSSVAHFAPGAALARLALGTAYVAAGMTSMFAFAFLLSTVTNRGFVAVAGGVGLTILSRVLNADYLPGVAVLNPYMPNNDVDLWLHLLLSPADTTGMVRFLVLNACYVAVFLAAAWWWFVRKDVLA